MTRRDGQIRVDIASVCVRACVYVHMCVCSLYIVKVWSLLEFEVKESRISGSMDLQFTAVWVTFVFVCVCVCVVAEII